MNNTEPFDNWIRDEIDRLDAHPKEFDADALWQKMQPELAPLSSRRTSSFRHALSSERILSFQPTLSFRPFLSFRHRRNLAAAAVLLLMVSTLGWWLYPTPPAEVALEKVPARAKTVTKPADVAYATTIKALPKTKAIRQMSSAPTIQKINSQPIEKEEIKPIEIANIAPAMQPLAVPQKADSTLKVATNALQSTKPKFRVVHANELADYQRAELAEARAKEAEKQGFVVINWKSKEEASANNLRTYLRSKKEKSQ
jgi:hypothetical protein